MILVRILFSIISAIVILHGLSLRESNYVTEIALILGKRFHKIEMVNLGASIYLSMLVILLVATVVDAVRFKRGQWASDEDSKTKVAIWLEVLRYIVGYLFIGIEGFVVFFGLYGLLSEKYEAAGWLIWGGLIGFYILSWLIMRDIANVPVRITYGGWRVRTKR